MDNFRIEVSPFECVRTKIVIVAFVVFPFTCIPSQVEDAHNVFNGTHLNGIVSVNNGVALNGTTNGGTANGISLATSSNNTSNMNGASASAGSANNANNTTTTTMHLVSANVEPALHQMLRCVEAMRVDLQQINNRINIVERSLADVRQQQLQLHRGKQVRVSVSVNVLSFISTTKVDDVDDADNVVGTIDRCAQQANNMQSPTCSGGGGCGVVGGSGSLLGRSGAVPAWWPFKGVSPAWFVILAIVWPLVARRTVGFVQRAANGSIGGRRR